MFIYTISLAPNYCILHTFHESIATNYVSFFPVIAPEILSYDPISTATDMW